MPLFSVVSPTCLRLLVHLKTGASFTRITAIQEDALVITTTARPIRGAANAALRVHLARSLRLHQTDIEIRRGEHSHVKTLHIASSPADIPHLESLIHTHIDAS